MQDASQYSGAHFDKVMESLIGHLAPATILDIGAGAGKFGRIARTAAPRARLTGIEMGEDSVVGHKLHEIYDEILAIDARDLITHHSTKHFDLVILGDLIEHMRKSDGIDLLNWLCYHAAYTVLITPEAMMIHRDPWYEGHNSVWSELDFAWHKNWATFRILQSQMFILRGFPANPTPLRDLVVKLNAERHPIIYSGQHTIFGLNLHDRIDRVSSVNEAGQPITIWWQAN